MLKYYQVQHPNEDTIFLVHLFCLTPDWDNKRKMELRSRKNIYTNTETNKQTSETEDNSDGEEIEAS